jgi:predicted lipoprotein with Yx(FWY)xxD motif
MAFPAPRTRAWLLAVAAGASIVLGACSSAATPVPATPTPTTPAPATSAPASVAPASSAPASASPSASSEASPSAASGGTYTLAIATGSMGKFLTGEDGKTLYTFKNDTPNSGASTCTGGCADNWPPFTLDAGEKAAAGTGVTGKIATITRADGKAQVTYNGAPLYYFAGDTKAGDTNGQGISKIWYVAAP